METQLLTKKTPTEENFDDETDELLINPNAEGINVEPEEIPVSLDDIFEKIGFGPYQLRLILMVGMVAAAEGAQIIVVTFCLSILQNKWNFSNNVQSFIISLNFAGLVVGGATAGFFADKFGRMKPMIVSLVLITVLNAISGLATDIAFFGLIRFLLGFFLGFFAPLGFTMVVENMPKAHRGKLVILATSFMFVGQLLACLLASVTVKNLTHGDWKALIIWSTVLLVIPLIVNCIYLDESVRYQLVMGDFESAFALLNKIIKFNKTKGYECLSEQDRDGLREWESRLAEEVTDDQIASISALFKGKYKYVTGIIWLGSFINSFIYYGVILILPFVLQRISEKSGKVSDHPIKNNDDLLSITVSILIESLSVVIAVFLVDRKSFGRRRLLTFFYFLTALTSLAELLYISRQVFVLWATLVKIFIDVCSYYYYLISVEIYPTKNRATGVGVASAVGKIASVVMPWLCIPLAEWFLFAPFGLFSLFCFIAAMSTFGLPTNTREADLK